MRKLLILFGLLFTFALSQAQQLGIIASQDIAAAGYCAEYQAVYDLLDAKPEADTAAAQNDLVEAGIAHGWWAKGDLIYVTAQRTQAGALLNWPNPSGDDNITNTTDCAFTKYQGFTGASVTSEYMVANWNPSSESVNFTLNEATISAYTRIDINAAEVILGCFSTNYITLIPRNAGSLQGRLNDLGTIDKATANSLGLSTVVRINSTTLRAFKNGTPFLDVTVNSTAIPNTGLNILKSQTGSFSNNQVSFIYIGGLLSNTEVSDMNTDVETYLDFVGAGVE